LYGVAPTLDPGGPTRPNRLNDALVPTVDFRSVYATILNRLGGDPNLSDGILFTHFEDLGFFGAPSPSGTPSSTSTSSTTTTTTPAGGTGGDTGKSTTSTTSTSMPTSTTSTSMPTMPPATMSRP
jgi:hypothetical protein